MAWNDLTLPDKARMITLAVRSGITDLKTIQEVYNTYAYGGQRQTPTYRGGIVLDSDKVTANKYDKGGSKGDKNTLEHPSYNAAQEEAMYNYLISRGLNDIRASSILGNLAVESYLNADMQQKGGPAYGLIQAEAGRQKAMKNFNDVPYVFGSNLSPKEQQQLDYIIEKGLNSYTSGEWGKKGYTGAREARKAFLNADSLDTASDIFTFNYLRPSKPHTDRRRQMTHYFYDKYNSNRPFSTKIIK